MLRNKNILLFNCTSAGEWIGGVYYIKNILYMISQNTNILDKYTIMLTVDSSTKLIFSNIKNIEIIELSDNKYISNIQKIYLLISKKIKYIYNYKFSYKKFLFNKKGIYWIPDFQDKHLPQYFSQEELERRKNDRIHMANSNNPIILSSNDALKDYNDEFSNYSAKPYVVHFISYIEPEIKSIDKNYENNILNKYNLRPYNYVFIANQFWQHKNHIIIFKMIKLISEKGLLDNLKFVFTGEIKDYRNPNYYNQLLELAKDPKVKDRTQMLGFIDRKEQLTLMKNSKFLIQPSLFEGWGTVLEDAKVLDKIVLLSDIPVHREQMNENCILFNPYDEEDLMDVLINACNLNHEEDIDKGIEGMRKRAKKYSESLEKCLLEN